MAKVKPQNYQALGLGAFARNDQEKLLYRNKMGNPILVLFGELDIKADIHQAQQSRLLHISNSVWSAQHPNAGRNIQHMVLLATFSIKNLPVQE